MEASSQAYSRNMDDEYPVYLIRKNTGKNSPSFRSRIRRVGPYPQRLIQKNGCYHVKPSRWVRPILASIYIHDLANVLIQCSWKWTLVIVASGFMLSWFLFACIWMMIAINNGDLDHLGDYNGTLAGPCLSGVQGFAGYMMFSIETQQTIGYGNRSVNEHCPEAVLMLCLQILAGVCIAGILMGIVYEKISAPKRINSMNSFSKCAVVCQRDGELCLIFRVRDRDRRYQCHNEIKAYLVGRRARDELHLESIKLEPFGILMWPIEVVHKITNNSPLWDLSAKDLIMKKRFEIIVTMEGTSLSTMNTSSTTTSYLSNEILWGHIFIPCVEYDSNLKSYIVNHKLFNQTRETITPLCSAKRIKEVLTDLLLFNNYYPDTTFTSSSKLSDSAGLGGYLSRNGSSETSGYGASSAAASDFSANNVLASSSASGDVSASASVSLSTVTVHRSSETSDNETETETDEVVIETRNNDDESVSQNEPLLVSLAKFMKESVEPYYETSF